jgi:hypothetical protein
MHHKWTELDDIAALYVYKFGEDTLTSAFLCGKLDIERSSFAMRVQNFQAIDGQGGLSNYAEQSAAIYQRFKSLTESQLRETILNAIELQA